VKTIILHKNESSHNDFAIILNTLQKDTSNSGKEAHEHIYRQLRNADPPDEETAKGVIDKLFFSDKRYDLGEVGRYRINRKLNKGTLSSRSACAYQRRYRCRSLNILSNYQLTCRCG
jgi:DNA-directed RNA polymerase subunit beta